jgi:hypothetical protein
MLDATNATSESKIVKSLRRSAPRIGVSWTRIDRMSRQSGTPMRITLDPSANQLRGSQRVAHLKRNLTRSLLEWTKSD